MAVAGRKHSSNWIFNLFYNIRSTKRMKPFVKDPVVAGVRLEENLGDLAVLAHP